MSATAGQAPRRGPLREAGTGPDDGQRTPASAAPAASAATPAKRAFRAEPGRSVEIDCFGHRIPGTVLRASDGSAAVSIAKLSDVRAMRIGARVKAVFAAQGAAAEITCGLVAMSDHVVLNYLGEPRLIQRRRHERITLEVRLEVAWRDRGAGAWTNCHAVTQDVSAGGVRLTLLPGSRGSTSGCTSAPAEGAVVLLALPTTAGIETTARLLRVADGELRMEFVEPPSGFFPALVAAGRR